MKNIFLKRAVDPQQYDFEDVFWDQEVGLSSPTREWFWEYIRNFSSFWENKDVLDVGCGTGWLLELLKKNGARSAEGFDPSQKNVEIAHKLYPEFPVSHSKLESFKTKKQYDVVFAIMSFGHIADPEGAFQKIYQLLRIKGDFIITVPNYEYFKKSRYDYIVEVKDINEDEFVTQTRRPHWGLIAEIVRKTSIYKNAATKVGFNLLEEVSMKPTQNLIVRASRYQETRENTLADLLHFQKNLRTGRSS